MFWQIMISFIRNFIFLLSDIAPYFLLGLLIAGLLKVFLPQERLALHLGEKRFFSILKAALIGIPLPLCSCGVLPVAVSLRRHGAGIPAVLSFLVATPQTSIDALFITYGLFGGAFALAYALAALMAGVLAGVLGYFFPSVPPESSEKGLTCCKTTETQKSPWGEALKYAFLDLSRELAKPFSLGLFLAALLVTIFPPGFLGTRVPQGFAQYLIMLLAGIPVYMCSTGSLPLAYSFYLQGFSPGSLLVFLMSGPATNVTSLVVIKKIFGPRAFFLYAGSLILGALSAGILLDYLIQNLNLALVAPEIKEESLAPFQIGAAIFLGGLLLYHLFWPFLKKEKG